MSTSSLTASELGLVLRRRRNLILLVVLAAAPLIIGLALRLSTGEPRGPNPGLLAEVASNGLFLGFSALILLTPFFMPLTMAVVSGDAIAGESAGGTLRYLLTVPVARGRVLAVKYTSCVVFGLVAAVIVVASGMIVGALLFPVGDVTLLSGQTVGFTGTVGRALLMASYAAVMLAGLAAIGMFISTLTEVPATAMATTAAVPVVAQILGAIPQLSGLHPWLLTDTWRVYGDFLREPMMLETIQRGLLTQAAYAVIFLSLAWARLTTRDVTS
ncbi:ABC transporter permease [Phytoactinopolyspora limicola]|uniref:ABC transporter permease n=1 Tax=Phytoactinopolyspora limicola TaxID=2715536 RepID=UPI00140B45A3|nr:ABC transporter permease subunit [Phytoactinopolyspora limicola]